MFGIFISSGVLFAYSNPQLEKGLDTLGVMMEKKFSKQEQIQRYTVVQKVLLPLLPKRTGKQKQDLAYIIARLGEKVKTLSYSAEDTILPTKKTENTKNRVSHAGQQKNLPNVDIQKIQKTRLERHNTERKKLGLPAYTLHEKLNSSAFTWAKHLSTL